MSLEMKYFVLKPKGTSQFAKASRAAMRTFAQSMHGHLHHNVLEDKRYINVSCEQSNLTPRTLDSWLEERL